MKKLIIYLSLSIICNFLTSGCLFAKVYDYTDDNKITLLQNVRESIALKLNLVKNAKHHIHIMTYFIDHSNFPMELMKELNKAHERGVDVRFITTYIPSLAMDFFGKAKKELVRDSDSYPYSVLSYMSMIPGSNLSITNNIHEKIFLVDGKEAILGGRNITDKVYTSKDLEIILEGNVVNQVQKHFEEIYSFLAMLKIKHKCFNFKQKCIKKINDTKFSDKDPDYYPEQPRFENGAKARILTNETLLHQYQNDYSGDQRFLIKDDIIETLIKIDFNTLRAYNYFVIPSESYKTYLEKKLSEGKNIEMITNSKISAASISENGYLYDLPEMYDLMVRGLHIYQWQGVKTEDEQDRLSYLHEKVMLFDEDHVVLGSHNYNAGSSSVSSEIAVEFYSSPVATKLIDIFDAEKNNTKKTNDIGLSFVKNEINVNKKKIKFLHHFFIRNILRQAY